MFPRIAETDVARICSTCFFKDTATTEIYTLSLHDALPIFGERVAWCGKGIADGKVVAIRQRHISHQRVLPDRADQSVLDRKSTRLNSSHANTSYAVFCLRTTSY